MSNVQISTPFNISLDFEIAPFFKRLVAYFLDLMIMVAYAVFMRYFLYSGLQLEGESAMGIDILLVSVPLLLYHLVFEIIFHGQSLGKMAMGIRVMSMDGGDPAISQYLLRWFFRVWEWPLVFSFVYPGFWIIYQLIIVGMFGIIVIIIFVFSSSPLLSSSWLPLLSLSSLLWSSWSSLLSLS